MGKRYYCDYCDRSFKDNSDARKKHISSLQHINNRAEHYRHFEDPEDILREEVKKIPCKNLMTYGECLFGNNCKFSHFSPPMIWELQNIVAWKKWKTEQEARGADPNPSEIINEFFQNTLVTNNEEPVDYPNWSIPLELKTCPNLPPSLWQINPQTVTDSNFAQWG